MPDSFQTASAGEAGANANVRAAAIVIAAFAVFSGTDALVKPLSAEFRVPQVAFMITLAALLLVVGGRAFVTRDVGKFVPRQPGLALIRALLLAGDTLLIYYAFATLPLAEAYVLSFLSPILVASLSFVFLGERLSLIGGLGVALGFAGVAVALRPGAVALNFGHVAAIGSALLFALSLVLLRKARSEESDAPLVITLFLVLTLTAFLVAMATGGFDPVGPRTLALAVLAGALLYAGHALLVRAFRIGQASVVAPFQYSQIVWGCLYGVMLFDTPIEICTVLGGVIIIFSGWLVLQ